MTSPWVMPPASTRKPPNQITAAMARLMIALVSGFKSAEMRPTVMEVVIWSSLACAKRSFSFSCLEKARMTRTPERFSRVISEMRSSFFWIMR